MDFTTKQYKYIFSVIDGNSFWEPVKNHISAHGSAFTSAEFKDHCEVGCIQHVLVTTEVPRLNGQVEILKRIIQNVLAKMTVDDMCKWFKHVPNLQQTICSNFLRAIQRLHLRKFSGFK